MEAIVEAGAGIGWRARVRHDVWQVELRWVVHDMMATPGTCAFPTRLLTRPRVSRSPMTFKGKMKTSEDQNRNRHTAAGVLLEAANSARAARRQV